MVQTVTIKAHCHQLLSCIEQLEDSRATTNWVTQSKLKQQQTEMDNIMENKISTRLRQTKRTQKELHKRIKEDIATIDNIKFKGEGVMDDLNNAFETLRDALVHAKFVNT